jgi:hypothetical protein
VILAHADRFEHKSRKSTKHSSHSGTTSGMNTQRSMFATVAALGLLLTLGALRRRPSEFVQQLALPELREPLQSEDAKVAAVVSAPKVPRRSVFDGAATDPATTTPTSLRESEVYPLHIQLLERESGAHVRTGTVGAYQGMEVVQTRDVDARGSATFSLEAGEYRLVIDPDSLPPNLVPPSRQDVGVSHTEVDRPRDFAPTVILGDRSEANSVQLFAYATALVRGQIVSNEIGIFDDVRILFAGIDKRDSAIRAEARVDKSGRFELAVYPTVYRIHPIYTNGFHGPPLPRPTELAVLVGEQHFVHFRIDAGPCAISCTLLDPALLAGEDPLLWEEVRAHLYHAFDPTSSALQLEVRGLTTANSIASAITDGNGTLRISGLNPGHYKLQFEADGFTPKARSSRFGAWIEPLHFELIAVGLTDVGPHVAYRARPCEYRLSLESGSLRPTEIVATLQYPKMPNSSRDPYVRQLEIPGSGIVEFFVHTSPNHAPALLELGAKVAGYPPLKVQLDATPNGRIVETIEFH